MSLLSLKRFDTMGDLREEGKFMDKKSQLNSPAFFYYLIF